MEKYQVVLKIQEYKNHYTMQSKNDRNTRNYELRTRSIVPISVHFIDEVWCDVIIMV